MHSASRSFTFRLSLTVLATLLALPLGAAAQGRGSA